MQPYIPQKLPPDNIEWSRLIQYLGPASAEVGRFDGIVQSMLNPTVLLSPLTTKEAVLSSKIEGTQATLQEVLSYEANPSKDKVESPDIQEILNYRKAIYSASEWLNDKPISLNMFRYLHSILMDSVRGQNRSPGEFRKLQNWIGAPGCTIENATYVPPSPNTILVALDNLEKYINSDSENLLVQTAIIHAQFEIIHPFLDGNGRLGRILITMYLYIRGLISSPVFYLSEYFEAHRDEYYYHLNCITKDNNWTDWIIFFLIAVKEQSKRNFEKAKQIIDLYEVKKKKITELTHSQFALYIVDTLFKMPLFNSSQFAKESHIPVGTSRRLLKILNENEVISEVEPGAGRTPTSYVFNKLFDIVK
jgi:Fic family protein